jgi:hypothetical protein
MSRRMARSGDDRAAGDIDRRGGDGAVDGAHGVVDRSLEVDLRHGGGAAGIGDLGGDALQGRQCSTGEVHSGPLTGERATAPPPPPSGRDSSHLSRRFPPRSAGGTIPAQFAPGRRRRARGRRRGCRRSPGRLRRRRTAGPCRGAPAPVEDDDRAGHLRHQRALRRHHPSVGRRHVATLNTRMERGPTAMSGGRPRATAPMPTCR